MTKPNPSPFVGRLLARVREKEPPIDHANDIARRAVRQSKLTTAMSAVFVSGVRLFELEADLDAYQRERDYEREWAARSDKYLDALADLVELDVALPWSKK